MLSCMCAIMMLLWSIGDVLVLDNIKLTFDVINGAYTKERLEYVLAHYMPVKLQIRLRFVI